MTFIVGYNVLGATPAAFNLTSPKKLSGASQQAVIPADHHIVEVHVGWINGNGTASGNVRACLYDEGNAAANKPMLAGTSVTIPYNAATLGAGAKWVSLTGLNIDVSAHAGKSASVGLGSPSQGSNSGFNVLLSTVTGAARSNHNASQTALPDPFVVSTTTADQAWSAFFVLEPNNPAPTATIDTLGSSGTIRVGQTEAITTSNLGTLTTGTFGAKSFASLAAPSGDGNVTLGAFVDGEVYPAMGTLTVAVGDGSATASKTDAVLNTMPGWQYVNVSAIDTTDFSLGKAFGGGDLPTQLHVINDGTGVLNPNGTLTNWPVGTFTCWARMAAGTWPVGTMKSFTFTVHEPINTTGSDLAITPEFSSPVLIPGAVVNPDDLLVLTSLEDAALLQGVVLNPLDLVVSLSLDSVTLEGPSEAYVYPNDFIVSLSLDSAVIEAAGAAYVYPHDLVLSATFSGPFVGNSGDYSGPFVSSRIVVVSSKPIV